MDHALLQSGFLAEAFTLLILLAGAILLYRSFRERYLAPWISGWIVYGLSRSLTAFSGVRPESALWTALAQASFAVAVGLFSASVFRYVDQPALLLPTQIAVLLAAALGAANTLWFPRVAALHISFVLCTHGVAALAALRLALFARGRGLPGLWLLTAMLMLLHAGAVRPSRDFPGYDLLADLLLGLSMMLIVLDDSRVQVQRLGVLNRISRVISETDEFYAIVEAALAELIQTSGARAAWFRILRKDKLRLAAHQGLSDAFIRDIREIDVSTLGGWALREEKVAIQKVHELEPDVKARMLADGFHHLVVVPVLGKSSHIGVVVLGMPGYRGYTEQDRNFLKAAAGQLGLAAENRVLAQQFARSQDEWASTINSIPDYVLVHDSEHRILQANRALLERLKLPFQAVLRQPCQAVLPGGGTRWQACPYCFPSVPPGTDAHDPCFGGYSIVSSSAYSGADLSQEGAVHVIKDITAIKAAEERYKTLFNQLHEGVFVVSPKGKILDCNAALARMLGYSSREEVLNLKATRSLYVDMGDRRRFLAELERQGFVRNFEIVLRRRDGSLINVLESSFATRDAQGTIERYQGVLLDVSEKKRAEDETRRRNRELHILNDIAVTLNQSFDLEKTLRLAMRQIAELFSADTVSVCLFDEEAKVVRKRAGHGHRGAWLAEHDEQNERLALPPDFVRALQAKRAEIMSFNDPAWMPETVKNLISMEGLVSGLWTVLWHKDRILGLLGAGSRVQREFTPADENVLKAVGRQLVTTMEKIQLYDETRKAYDEQRRMQEHLLQSEKMSAMGQLVSGVAHELNNPLAAILGYTQLLETENLEPRAQEFVQKLHKQALRTQKIVQNLLSFARQHKPHRAHVDLRNVMEDTIALRDYDLRAHNILVERNFQATLPCVVGDPHQLEQVYLNIMNNAADAMLEGSGGGLLKIRIFSENGLVISEFQDTGPGLADPKRVFDPFYTTKGVGKGTGLGLSICYGIVTEHGGEISAQNAAGGGALVRVRLPAAVGEKPLTERERIVARRECKLEGHALLVDGEKAMLDLEREVLTAAGLEVTALASGETAIEWLKNKPVDIVLMDAGLVGVWSSKDLFHWIQESQPDLAAKIVLALSPAAPPGVHAFVDSTKMLCLIKPFEVSDLLAVVRRVLRQTKEVFHPAP